MFTGLIADLGRVEAVERGPEGSRFEIAGALSEAAEAGDSIAVNGACLTVTRGDGGRFSTDVMNQTLEVTALGSLAEGDPVNLEPAMRLGNRLDGHLVQGHVDGVGTIASISDDGFAKRVEVEIPAGLRRYTVEHGSVALNGVSLTIAALTETGVEVSLIPETLGRTTFGTAQTGNPVNVEVDLIARYAERLMQGYAAKGTR